MAKRKLSSQEIDKLTLSFLNSSTHEQMKQSLIKTWWSTHFKSILDNWSYRSEESRAMSILRETCHIYECVGKIIILQNKSTTDHFVSMLDFSESKIEDGLPIELIGERLDKASLSNIIQAIRSADNAPTLNFIIKDELFGRDELLELYNHIYPIRNDINHNQAKGLTTGTIFEIKGIEEAKIIYKTKAFEIFNLIIPKKMRHIKMVISAMESGEINSEAAARIIIDVINYGQDDIVLTERLIKKSAHSTSRPMNVYMQIILQQWWLLVLFSICSLAIFFYFNFKNQPQAPVYVDTLTPVTSLASESDPDLSDILSAPGSSPDSILKYIDVMISQPLSSAREIEKKSKKLNLKISKLRESLLRNRMGDGRVTFESYTEMFKLKIDDLNKIKPYLLDLSIQTNTPNGFLKSIYCWAKNCPEKEVFLVQDGSICPFEYNMILNKQDHYCIDQNAKLSIKKDDKEICIIEGKTIQERFKNLEAKKKGECADIDIIVQFPTDLEKQLADQTFSINALDVPLPEGAAP